MKVGRPEESAITRAKAICGDGVGVGVDVVGDDDGGLLGCGGGRRRRVGGQMSAWKTGKGTISDR